MASGSKIWLLALLVPFFTTILQSSAQDLGRSGLKTAVFLSPKFELESGSVCNKFYYNIDFPKGHIALKGFDAEVIDEEGNPVPLYETYLHHWVVLRYYRRKGVKSPKYHDNLGFQQSDFIIARNSGICNRGLSQYFGLGSETRKTATHVPDPYGIEVGNPEDIPAGYEEQWMLNVHAIDTRGAEDRLGCTECRCDLYNVTVDEYGNALDPDYIGGLKCCYDETRCRVKEGVQSAKRGLYLKYTVKYVDWDASIVPVRIYILDVTDLWGVSNKSSDLKSRHDCLIEYTVESGSVGVKDDACIDTKKVTVNLPKGGHVIYGVGHQHTGGIGSSLHGKDGRVICSSRPLYGEGKEPGNEKGYIVGMSTCYPESGSVTIADGEELTLASYYNCARRHTGVMGLFYLLIADSLETNVADHASKRMHEKMTGSSALFSIALFGIVLLAAAVLAYQRRVQREDTYERIAM